MVGVVRRDVRAGFKHEKAIVMSHHVCVCAKVQQLRSLTNVSDLAAQLSDDHLIVMPHPIKSSVLN